MSKTRIYVVVNPDLNYEERLVEASSQSQAERHVTAPIKVRIATQQDLIRLLGSDVEIEKAGAGPLPE